MHTHSVIVFATNFIASEAENLGVYADSISFPEKMAPSDAKHVMGNRCGNMFLRHGTRSTAKVGEADTLTGSPKTIGILAIIRVALVAL
jgi:hypothetical protein